MWTDMVKERASGVLIVLMCFCEKSILEYVQGQTANYNPAMFIFGDSLSDVGNNNYILLSTYKANFYPHGIDYPRGVLQIVPTGRFCNGRLALDILATRLNFSVPRPYLSPTSRAFLLQGVNYASAGCGILHETSNNSCGCLSLSTQLSLHKRTVQRLAGQIGSDEAEDFLKKSLYFVSMGSNDYLGNFLSSQLESVAAFIDRLTAALANEIKILYSQNARRIVIMGLGPLGCIPSQRVRAMDGSCNEALNSWVQSTNVAFHELVGVLSEQFSDARITFANPFNVARDVIQNPSNYGLKVTNKACCGGGRLRAQTACLPTSRFCSNRSGYMFWDAWHPTEALNRLVVDDFLSSNTTYVAPWSMNQVAFGVQ